METSGTLGLRTFCGSQLEYRVAICSMRTSSVAMGLSKDSDILDDELNGRSYWFSEVT